MLGKIGGNEIPPMRVSAVSVNEEKTGPAALAPALIAHLSAFHLNRMGFVRCGYGGLEPFGRWGYCALVFQERAALRWHFRWLVAHDPFGT